ncbi:MAG TPA: hypothetical protein VHO06_26105, partial [Polyangia bacterium]|nr:hypothetical protein [Polyangia bacterium]
MARVLRAILPAFALAAALAPAARAADDDGRLAAALAAALPPDRAVDLLEIDQPNVPDAPRVRAATHVAAAPAAIKDVLLAPAHYRTIIPSLIKSALTEM